MVTLLPSSQIARARAHIADVIEQMEAKRSDFVALSFQYGGQMQLSAYFKTNDPGLHLKRRLVESLTEYGLSVDFDFYYLYPDCREDS